MIHRLVCRAAHETAPVPTGRPRAWLATVAAGTIVTAGLFVGGGTAAAATRQASATLSPPPVPTSGGYLGGFIDPAGPGSTGTGTPIGSPNLRELAELGPFDASIGRSLSVVKVFEPWQPEPKKGVSLVPNAQLDDIASDGAIPAVIWNCGTSDASIIAGTWDSQITSYAKQLKAYGGPLFLFWFREPNLIGNGDYTQCLQGGNSTPTTGPEGYVSAWQHIYDIFQSVGATNVAFVWCPGSGGTLTPSYLESLYPGGNYVDWIGIDGYSRPNLHVPNPSFTALFGTPTTGTYGTLTAPGSVFDNGGSAPVKPMMISETGAVGSNQATYLDGALTALDSGDYTQLHGFWYFDENEPSCKDDGCDWALEPGSAGLDAFAAMAQNSYFSPTF